MMALYKNGEPINLLDAYDIILDALGITIAGQNITLLMKLAGVEQSVAIIESGTNTIDATAQPTPLDALSFEGFRAIDWHFESSIAAGSCKIEVQQSHDNGSTWFKTRFRYNDGSSSVKEATYNSGDGPVLITVRKIGNKCRLLLTPDGTNPIPLDLVSGTRRVI